MLAAYLPIWLGSQRFCQMRTRAYGPDDNLYLKRRETTALHAAQAAAEAAELEALEDGSEKAEASQKRASSSVRRPGNWKFRLIPGICAGGMMMTVGNDVEPDVSQEEYQ